MSYWHEVMTGLYRAQDSCVVYAIVRQEGTVLINAGSGHAAGHLDEIQTENRPLHVLLTHSFRDHSDGVRQLAAAGARVWAPWLERDLLTDVEQVYRERQTWVSYDNRWDRMAPLQPLPVTDWLYDYDKVEIAGLSWEVIPAPVASPAGICLAVGLDGTSVCFTGEFGAAGGKILRQAPLQYDYNDLKGMGNLAHLAHSLRQRRFEVLLPSFGEPSFSPDADLESIVQTVETWSRHHTELAAHLRDYPVGDHDRLREILPRLYLSTDSVAMTHYLVSGRGRVMALDYGYNRRTFNWPSQYSVANRRGLLHGMDALKARHGVERVDTVLLSHYHDDHVAGLTMLQRLFGTEVWAAERFADLLEEPMRFDRPCLWPEPIPVKHRLPLYEPFEWEGTEFRLYPLSGHTRFANLIAFEWAGEKVVHTGDQIFFFNADAVTTGFEEGCRLFLNHVYKNGLDLKCYAETLKHLQSIRPDLIISGHAPAYRPTAHWWKLLNEAADHFDQYHMSLMPLGENDIHFGPESQAAKLDPYRIHLASGPEPVELGGWVLNPFGFAAEAQLRLELPPGWTSEPLGIPLAAREQKAFRMQFLLPAGACCRRQAIGLDLTVGDRPFGTVTDALVTIGHRYW